MLLLKIFYSIKDILNIFYPIRTKYTFISLIRERLFTVINIYNFFIIATCVCNLSFPPEVHIAEKTFG
jgi:hypothetical protein